jgi:hypothetical protein
MRFFVSDFLVIGDQQTSDQSFRHCPILGEHLTVPLCHLHRGDRYVLVVSLDKKF